MNFLAMLIALALQQVLSPGNALQARDWLLSWDDFVGRSVGSPAGRLALVVVSVALAGYWLLGLVEGWIFGLPLLFLSAAMLLWSLGSDDYHTALERYDARRVHDPAAALACLDMLWMPGAAPHAEALEEGARARATAHRHLLYAGYARWFAPLLYFVIGGPLLAIVYRCVAVVAARRDEGPALRALALLDWLPARLLVLSFAITGDFLAVLERVRAGRLWTAGAAPDLLGTAASAACADASGPRAGADLLYRSSGLWLLIVSAVFLLL